LRGAAINQRHKEKEASDERTESAKPPVRAVSVQPFHGMATRHTEENSLRRGDDQLVRTPADLVMTVGHEFLLLYWQRTI
jgi:hypothetical protein